MLQGVLPYSILQYIVDQELGSHAQGPVKLPPMDELAKNLGVSRGKLREELVAVQAFGVVDMRPGDGTYVCPLDFYTAIRTLVLYGTACDWRNFDHLYKLRVQLETGFWEEATSSLTDEDKQMLQQILERAESKLTGTPIEIPHREHQNFHLLIYSRLDNTFVQGLLNVYWDAYEAVGLHRYFDFSYFEKMWHSHREMVEAILTGRYQEGKVVLARHFTLLDSRLHGTSDGEAEAKVVTQKGGPPLTGH
jgi:GntR family transcriptional repressor for pyruvate dehydrogenase complex